MSGGGLWDLVQVEENVQRHIEMKIHQLEEQIAAVKRNQLLSGVTPFQLRRLAEEEVDLNRSLRFEEAALVEKKAKVAMRRTDAKHEFVGTGPARERPAEGFERRFERRLNELLRPAGRGLGVDAGGGLDRPFVDLSMSGPQGRRGQAVESGYAPSRPGGGLSEFKW
jgi:hypothetical protein